MEAKKWDKIAKDYFRQVASPFEPGVKNPLYTLMQKITGKERMRVIDLGTGVGNLLPFLEKSFGDVVAIDFSAKMLEEAKRRGKKTIFLQRDMRDLKGLYGRFDMAFAVNSILAPSVEDIQKMLHQAKKILKKQGVLVAVFPALEAVLLRAMLIYEDELQRNKKRAKEKTFKRIEKHRYDFVLGFMREEGRQKHFYQFELEYRLRQAGFKHITFHKIEYPWNSWEERYYAKFKGKPKMWDWLVIAKIKK